MDMETALAHAARKATTPITAMERDKIVALLRSHPIAEVKARTGRPYRTLFRLAEAAL